MSDSMEDTECKKNLSATYQSVADEDKEAATAALQSFEQGDFEQCLDTLHRLHAARSQDPKVYHNICVAEYFLSRFTKTDAFQGKMDELCKQAQIDATDIKALDDVDNCVILYNQAIVLYHLHQFSAAIAIADKLFQLIEPLDEALARNICFLLLELYLCVYEPKKALFLIGYIETMLFGSSKSCVKLNQKDGQKEASDGDISVNDVLKRRLQLCKARCYAMIKTSKACKREIKSIMASGSGPENIPAFYLKSQLEYQRGNYRKAQKLLNSITLPENLSKYFQETGDCLSVMYYNNLGCIHFYMGKPHLGQFYIRKAVDEFDMEIKMVTNPSKNDLDSRPVHLMCPSMRYQLIYNLGMQYLQGQKFHDAFNCFVEILPAYSNNPRLWLRIAECCIHIHNPDITQQYVEYEGKPFVKASMGAGKHKKLILNPTTETISEKNKSGFDVAPTLYFALLSLKNALFLLPECSIIDSEKENSPSQSGSEENNTKEETNTLSTLPAGFIQNTEIISLRNSVLASCAYVSLCLGEIILAYEYAKTLLNQSRISAAHKFLAHLYIGEALLRMDKITEAIDHLNMNDVGDIPLAIPTSSSENSLKLQVRFDSKSSEKVDDGSKPVGNLPNWFPNTLTTAKFVSQYNLAVAYALREEWAKAKDCILQMFPEGDMPSQATSLLVYILYHQGATDEARKTLKKYCTPSFTKC